MGKRQLARASLRGMWNRVKWLSGWLGLLLLGTTITMCGSSADSFCDAVCDCRGCSDREFDNCVYDYEDREDEADRRNCLDDWDDYASCVESGDGCRRLRWG